jgi:hypothetical protein
MWLTVISRVCYGSRTVFVQSGLMFNLWRLNRLWRGIAIFLLAFVWFDLTVVDFFSPELCGDEQVSFFFTSPAKSTEDAIVETRAGQTQDSQPDQDSHQSPIDEDCFCCCSHIIPGVRINIAVLNRQPQPFDQAITDLPSAPPHGTFHPPRLS